MRTSKEGLLQQSAATKIWLAVTAIALLFVFSLMSVPELQTTLISESGPIEWMTVALYAAALAYILLKGAFTPLKWIFFLVVFLMLRELDFDSRFTDAKITKSDFLLGVDVPLLQKIYGFGLLALMAWVLFKVVSTHAAGFLAELRLRTGLALCPLLIIAAVGLSKLVDGGRRKLDYVGVELSEPQVLALQLFEEVLELSIPLLIIVAVSIFAQRQTKADEQV